MDALDARLSALRRRSGMSRSLYQRARVNALFARDLPPAEEKQQREAVWLKKLLAPKVLKAPEGGGGGGVRRRAGGGGWRRGRGRGRLLCHRGRLRRGHRLR